MKTRLSQYNTATMRAEPRNAALQVGLVSLGMSEERKKILCIEDDHETAGLIAEELVDRGYEVLRRARWPRGARRHPQT